MPNEEELMEKLRNLIERLIDFSGITVEFKERKDGPKISMKISIKGLRKSCKNPILAWSLHSSIFARLSSQISTNDRKRLHNLYKNKEMNKQAEEEFEEEFRKVLIDTIAIQLRDKLNSQDIPTPIFPTSVASSEIPNYYIQEPSETYTLDTKAKLFDKLANSICGKCGQRIYGLYVPEEGIEIKEILKNHVKDFYNVNIGSVAEVGRINLGEIGPFEYMFYLLDKVLQEMFFAESIPTYHVELFVVEGTGSRKKFFSHYIIPNLNEVFLKLYDGEDRYTSSGISKIKALVSSLLVENWNIDNNSKKNNSEIAHAHINRLLYSIFCHRKLDIDSILFLEDLKIKLGDTTPIRYLEEVMSWM